MEDKPISFFLNKNGSDKCQSHTYQLVYDDLFKNLPRDYPIDLLESGVERGGSLSAWKEYFPNGNIIGIDPVDQRLPEFVRDDVKFVLEDIKKYQFDREFDLIIEDGNHSNEDALWATTTLPLHLKPGGVMILEDVQEGFLVPFLLWGKLHGDYVVTVVDMRRITNQHDNFLVKVDKLQVVRK